MTPRRMTVQEAKAAGLLDPGRRTRPRTTQRAAKGPYATRCHQCGEQFTTMASEDRHVEATGHTRYELEVGE